ncbi:inorganic diphosphatase [soil metagenome]
MSLLQATIGEGAPEIFNTVIEIPRGSTNKYEVDPETGIIKLDRVLYSPLFYPFDYGYIPQTLYVDGDPLDVLVLLSHPTFPGCLIEAAPIGVMFMTDDKGKDEKIIAVATKDPRYGYRRSFQQLNEHTLKEIEHFFRVYKELEEKAVEIHGFGDREEAVELIRAYTVAA